MYDQEFFGRSEDTVSLITVLKGLAGLNGIMYSGDANSRFPASGLGSGRSAGGSGRSCNGALQTFVGGYDYGASGQCFFPLFSLVTIALRF